MNKSALGWFARATGCMLSMLLATFTTADPNQMLNGSVPTNTPSMITVVPSPPKLDARAYVLIDANSGRILASKNEHKRIPPASLTKLMTMYVVSEALRSGRIKLDDKVFISEKAWRMGGSKMFVRANTYVPVKELIHGIIVSSGNDACVALAQYIAGNETTFAQMMDQTATQLGMKDTHYVDSTGLPKPDHYSTAYDMAILARALIQHFPEDYAWYKQKWFTYNNIRQPNRNRLLWRDPTVDGLKTGHTKAAGYCLIASAQRNGMRLISVVTGTPTDAARAQESQALLNYGFRYYQTTKLYDANTPLAKERVFNGKEGSVALGVPHDVYATFLRGNTQALKASTQIQTLFAPIQKGQHYGTLTVKQGGHTISELQLIALQNDPKGGLLRRWSDSFSLWFHKKKG